MLQRKEEANANASRVTKFAKLSEWGCEKSADGHWHRGGSVLRLNLLMLDRGDTEVQYTV
jgi:hypothetical protein